MCPKMLALRNEWDDDDDDSERERKEQNTRQRKETEKSSKITINEKQIRKR